MFWNLCQAADIVFMGLHGSNGEDGKVQATFDLLGIRYQEPAISAVPLLWIRSLTKRFSGCAVYRHREALPC